MPSWFEAGRSTFSCPFFFVLFINELTKDITENGKLSPDLIELLILLFVDDVVLFSDSVVGLQTQLNILYCTAKRLIMIVNFDKSNIVVFRNGGHLALREKSFLLFFLVIRYLKL